MILVVFKGWPTNKPQRCMKTHDQMRQMESTNLRPAWITEYKCDKNQYTKYNAFLFHHTYKENKHTHKHITARTTSQNESNFVAGPQIARICNNVAPTKNSSQMPNGNARLRGETGAAVPQGKPVHRLIIDRSKYCADSPGRDQQIAEEPWATVSSAAAAVDTAPH